MAGLSNRFLGLPLRVWLLLGLTIGILVCVGGQLADGKSVVQLLSRASPFWLLAALLLQFLGFVLRSEAWRLALKRCGAKVPLFVLIKLNLGKHFTDQALPTGGVSGSALVVQGLERRNVPRRHAVTAFVAQTIGSSSTLVLAVIGSLLLLSSLWHVPPAMWVGGGLVILVSTLPAVVVVLLALGKRPPLPAWVRRRKVVRSLLDALAEADEKVISRPGLIAKVLALNAAVTVVDAVVIWMVLTSLGLSASLGEAYVAQAVVLLARDASFLPGSLGTFDAATVGVLSVFGVGLAVALAATLLFRAVHLWFPLLPGALATGGELAGRRSASLDKPG